MLSGTWSYRQGTGSKAMPFKNYSCILPIHFPKGSCHFTFMGNTCIAQSPLLAYNSENKIFNLFLIKHAGFTENPFLPLANNLGSESLGQSIKPKQNCRNKSDVFACEFPSVQQRAASQKGKRGFPARLLRWL